MNVTKVGSFIRDQRTRARLSLRGLSGLAGVSIPYLSQVERGLRRPSAEILQAIARALRISAETLYVEAGILEERSTPDVVAAVTGDGSITERQKQALIQIYEAFRDETARTRRSRSRAAPKAGGATRRTASKTGGAATRRTARPGSGGRTGTRAHHGPSSPPSILPPPTPREEV